MLIFVSGPYTAPDDAGHLANANAAIDAGIALARRGHLPVVPHMSHWFDLRAEETTGERLPWQFYMDLCFALIRGCDALLYTAPSRGADLEKAEAERLGLPVYGRVEDVPAAGGR
jgi:hypothetical protein